MPGKIGDRIRCSFCNKTEDQVRKLIAGPGGVYICDECIDICSEIIEEELGEEYEEETLDAGEINLLKPAEIKKFLDEYVIGQEDAKKTLSVAVYNHYKRILAGERGRKDDVELQKSNILMLGPTGSGKTFLAQTLAKILNVPFAIADATSLTEAGYVGEDVENILLKIIQAADYDVKRAEHGMLKILEGTQASVPPQVGRKHPHQELIQIDTTNILFICGGAFEGLDKLIESRMDSRSMGFMAEITSKTETNVGELLRQVMPRDLIKFGMIPEFIGRVPVVVALDELDRSALIRILREPKNAIIRQYQRLFELDGVELEFEEAAVEDIADKTIERKTGARGLRAIIETSMRDLMFEIPSDDNIVRCLVTKDTIDGTGEPIVTYKDGATSGQVKAQELIEETA